MPAVTDSVLTDFASAIGTAGPVAVEGGRTRWDAGGAPVGDVRLVSAPAGIVDYTPSEMTVTVRAGTTVAALTEALRAEGQLVALPDRGGTVGGAVVVGENHRDVRGRGRVRDTVLQVRYVGADGQIITAGGPVVKNVTGFNLPRLIVGSLGTLGLVAELVLRTNPIPAASQWFTTDAAPEAVDAALYRPSSVLFDGEMVWTLLEGHPDDVEAQAAQLAALGPTTTTDTAPPLPPHRWSLAPAEALAFDRSGGPAVASVGVGTVWASAPQPTRPFDPNAAAVSARVKANFDPDGRLNPGRCLWPEPS